MDMELILGFLGDAAKTDFGQKVLLFFMAWTIVKKTVAQHLEKIEMGLSDVARSVEQLNQAMTEMKVSHDARLTRLEQNQKGE